MMLTEDRCGTEAVGDTPFGYTLSLISGKWKMVILYLLSGEPCIRYNALRRQIGKITYKTLSTQLKELEADGLVARTEYPQIPPKVEYSLTGRGRSLIPVLDAMCDWGLAQRPHDGEAPPAGAHPDSIA